MRLASNVLIRDALANQAISAVLDALFITGYLIILIALYPLFALASIVIAALQLTVLYIAASRRRALLESEVKAAADSQSYLLECLTGIETVKAAGAEK